MRLIPLLIALVIPQVFCAQDRLLPVFHFNHVSIADGLPTVETRSRVVRDRLGFIWIGTVNGLARSDGYSFKVYRPDPGDPNSLAGISVGALHIDRKGRLWVGTSEAGLSLYDPMHDHFLNFEKRQQECGLRRTLNVWNILEDERGDLWMGTLGGGGVVRVSLGSTDGEASDSTLLRQAEFSAFSPAGNQREVFGLSQWADGRILAGSSQGLFCVDASTGGISRLDLPGPAGKILDTTFVSSFCWQTSTRLWIGTYYQGLFLVDLARDTVLNYHRRPGGATRDDRISDIQPDMAGRLWIGTGSGLDLFDPSAGRYVDYMTYSPASWSAMFGMKLSIDSAGILWVSTFQDGLYFLRPGSLRLPHYSLPRANGRPRDMETINRWSDGSYWISTEGKTVKVDLTTLRILQTVDLFKGEKSTFQFDGATDCYDDGRGSLWYGTMGLGLYRFEPESKRVTNFRYGQQLTDHANRLDVCKNVAGGSSETLFLAAFVDGLMRFDISADTFTQVMSANIYHVMRDNLGNIWAAGENDGVFVLDSSGGLIDHIARESGNGRSLSHNRTSGTYQDPQGRIWVGARNVINLWEPTTRSFRHYPNEEFKHKTLATPHGSDARGRLWVGYTGVFLGILDPASGNFSNFDYSNGLCGQPNDMALLEDGRVVLTGYRGLNIVNPDGLSSPRPSPPLFITRMSINDTASVAPQELFSASALELSYNENVVELEFAAIDPGAAHLISYEYRLEGLEESWVRPVDRRYVRYPGLSPGEYVFRVRARSIRHEWPEKEIALSIAVLPPWWRTAWAYGAYILLGAGLLYGTYRLRLGQLKLRQQAQMEHFQVEHLAEVDRMKSRFFANISHEFRTPLTLILGPIRKWRDRAEQKDEQSDLAVAEHNAHRLLGLVNQLLDLSKLEAGGMKLHAFRMNIVPLVRGIANSFESSARLKGTSLNVSADEEEIEVYCDRDMLEKILSNLLSNAFKFTQEGGRIEVRVTHNRISGGKDGVAPRLATEEGERWGGGWVSIAVSDTGIGIPADQRERVFDRFYQVDASQTREYEGSGLGLALVKELVEEHHGEIHLQSEVGKGTTFTVRLPLGRHHLTDDEVVETPVTVEPAMAEVVESTDIEAGGGGQEEHGARDVDGSAKKPIVLVVEDNADVRAYIRGYLASAYEVIESRDGAEGVEKALEVIPDLVLSDVMMPKKDGNDLCRTLKNDERTSHVPIILLTAKAASENRIEGLETGADDYLVKPFEPRELLARVRNLISLRRKLRDRFSAAVPLRPGEIAVSSVDDVFLKKVMAVIEANISDENFSTEELARQACMSRTQLHRKLTALTGQSATEFVRYIRLHRGMELLKKNAGTVAEIAYSVGFGNPSYFSTRFHEQFGVTPSDVRRSPESATSGG